MKAYNSVMCGYFCIGFIDFMLKGKSLNRIKDYFTAEIKLRKLN